MDRQERVAAFVERHDMDGDPAYRLLDLCSEVGELAKDANESTDYGADPEAIAVNEDEVGDVLFSLLAFADSMGVDAGDALETAMAKYESRIDETGVASSGN